MNTQTERIPDTEEAWDERTLGADAAFVEVVDQAEETLINEAAGTQSISIRLSKSMIDDFKLLASLNGGLGYQTLMKQVLQRFLDSEKKRLFRELVTEKLQAREAKPAPVSAESSKQKTRKLA